MCPLEDQFLGATLRLRDRIAIVTGAASGIGRAIATMFGREGSRVFLLDVQADKGRQVEQEICQQGGKAFFVDIDLTDAAALVNAVTAAVSRFGGVDILVNNAAFYGPLNKKAVVDTPDEVWDRTMDVNLRSVFLLCKYCVPRMIERGGGSIINIASIGGLEAFPEFAAYSVSKAAVIQLTKTLAVDYGRHKIRANAICPGAIDTPGNEAFVENREQYLSLIASLTPLRDIGTPEDVAYAALYLASEESRYVTGTTLVVDGGRLALA